ncbi:MAG TPA: WXG100 family type VII secretion target [Amnibacterium sp.]|jgi:WXG100 family type VII secretion target|uniref:WXG100 family type VII secretion target n=1 Tax=Amnibacterium sp. TaxID=1872496 RepID=UPI002F9441FB
MTRYTVDSDLVASAASAVGGTVGRLQGEVSALQGQLDSLQDTWTGQAAVAFQGVMQQWRTTQANLEQVLGTIDRALRLAAQQYADIELANARLFG